MNKKVIIIGAIILCFVILVMYVFFSLYGSPIGKAKFCKECRNYLTEMYNEKMTIVDVVYSFKTQDYFANISVDNTDITFHVVKDGVKLSDNYFIEYWKHETSNDITEVVTTVYGKNKGTGSLYFTQGSPISNSDYKIENKVPSFLSVRNKFNTSIFGFVNISAEFDSANCLSEYEQIYKVIKYVFEKYSPKNIVLEFSDDAKFKIEIEDFKQLKNKTDIQNYKQQ